MRQDLPDWMKFARERMDQTPFFAHLRGEVVEIAPAFAKLRMPWGPHLVGNPESGAVHGGVITALLDHAAGAAVMAALDEPLAIATLDLRIDYFKPAVPSQAITAEVRCLKITREIAFVRGTAYQTSPDEPAAICTGAFMLLRDALPFNHSQGE